MASFTGKKAHKALGDVQRQFTYEVEISLPAAFTNSGMNDDLLEDFNAEGLNGVYDKANAVLKFGCYSVSIPQRSNQSIEKKILNVTKKFPGMENFGNTIDLEFHEYESQIIQRVLYRWKEFINVFQSEKDGLVSQSADNAAGGTSANPDTFGLSRALSHEDIICPVFRVKPLKYNGLNSKYHYSFANGWLEAINPGSFGNENNSIQTVNSTFSFDWYEMVKN